MLIGQNEQFIGTKGAVGSGEHSRKREQFGHAFPSLARKRALSKERGGGERAVRLALTDPHHSIEFPRHTKRENKVRKKKRKLNLSERTW